MSQKWYAVYTNPRWEKKVADSLEKASIEVYCPLNTVIRQWSDRKKKVLVPLFPSYVFVRISESQIPEIRKVNGVMAMVSWLGKPAVIRDEEIDTIRRFLKEYQDVKLEKVEFHVNEKVRLTEGVFMDKEGKVIAVKNNTIQVALPSLNYVMCAEVEKSSAIKIL